jgi:uncharacterized protein involved in outer membrane biogenesis
VAVALYTILGFLVIPALARSLGERKLSELLHRRVSIAQIRLNPYALSVTVRGLRIVDRDGARDLFTLKELYVNLGIASLFKGGVVVQQVRVVEPRLELVRTAEDRYNFSDIVDDLASGPAAPPPPATKPTRFSVSNIQLVDGHVALDDRVKSLHHELAALNISVPFLSNFPYLVETFVQPAFSAVINGTRLALDGRTKPFADSLESSVDLNLLKVDLPYYLAYVPVKLRMKLRSAILDTKLKITFLQYRDRPPRVDVAGSIALSDVDILDDGGRPLVKLPLLDIDVASSDLLSNQLSIRRILLKSLTVHVRRDRRGDLQLQSLVASEPAATPAPASSKPKSAKAAAEAKSSPWTVQLETFSLDGARIVFSDASNEQPFQTTVAPLNVTVSHFTTAPSGRAAVAVTLVTDGGEHLSVDGKLGVAPFAFDGTLAFKGLALARFAPYYASKILFDVRGGTLEGNVPVHVAKKGSDLDLVIAGLAAELRDLQLRRRSDRDDFLRLPSLALRETTFDLRQHELTLGNITTSDARIRLERGGAAQPWNVEMLLPVPPSAPKAAEAKVEPKAASTDPNRKEEAFAVTVQRLDLKGWAVRIEDRAPGTTATTVIDRIGLRVEGLGTARGKQGRVDLQARLNQTGALDVAGTLGITPLQANVRVQLKTLPVVPVQPYFQDSVGLLLTSGHVGADGRVTVGTAGKATVARYKGEISAGDFVAVSRDGTDELARVGGLRVSGIDLVTEPFKMSVDEIALKDYAANVVINPDKTLNLASIVPPDTAASQKKVSKQTPSSPPPSPAPSAASPAPLPVHIGAVVLSDGTINVEDRSTHPAFATSLSRFGGRVSGLSFDEGERATVALSGMLGNGPLEIGGKINPLAKKPFIDVTFKLADVDLSAMTPYSGKYAGYAIEKGQLYLDLKYLIDARKLNAQNNVKLSQFTFGQSIDSKDATHLPVRLAVSLLKDRHGVIQLEVPVTGSLDDPKFSVWGVVLTVVKNLLVKAATSPFALIGSLFGSGEDLAWLEFEPGQSDIGPGQRAKLDTLAKALFERPGLHLEIEGHASPVRDREALRRQQLQRKVKAQKMKETVAAGSDSNTNVVVTDAEYPKYLKRAYEAEPGIAKPKNALGMLKDIPVAEMERLLLGAIVATDDDLRLLARQRAQTAREHILHAKKIETERVFLVEPKSIAPEPKDKVGDCRVDFRLQ